MITLPHDQDRGLDHPNLEEVLRTFSVLALLHVNSRFFGEFPVNNETKHRHKTI